jgi:hypothetical protein
MHRAIRSVQRSLSRSPQPTVALRVAALSIALLAAASAAAAQTPTGTVRGQVLADGTGAVAATIELLQDGDVVRRVVTDAAGNFQFTALPAGTYELKVQHVGYRTPPVQLIDVAGGLTRTIRVELQPAPVELEGVSVVTTGVRIDPRSTEFATSFTEQQIRMLPLGHDPASIVGLTAGARAGHVWGGATAQANNYQIDGLAANHPGVGGDLIQLSMNWIERVEVRGLGAGAEHGNFQGGLVNVVTKSGGNTRQTMFRSTVESHALNSSNLQRTEIGSEVRLRYDVEAETRGPIVRDRLFYYTAGQLTRRDQRFLSHLPGVADRYSPVLQENRDARLFSKLTWRPDQRHLVEASLIHMDTRGEHVGNTGYEFADATSQQQNTATLGTLQWQLNWDFGVLDARLAHMRVDETRAPYQGVDVPGIQTFALLPPFISYQNAPLFLRHAPESTTGTLSSTFRIAAAGQDHILKVGAEHSAGRHLDQRLRTGGLTWRPARRPSMSAADPTTWNISPAYPFVPVTFGGEVDLQATVENSALFAQASIALGRRLTLNPGYRFGRWVGRLTPGGGAGPAFEAVRDQAGEARLGAIFDVTGNNSFVLKGHWGRYHQSMIAQFFDRAAGGSVFTDEEHWHVHTSLVPSSTTTFSAADRERMIEAGQLLFQRRIILNESGPVRDYRQPYVDQWLAGVEKAFGTDVKLEALYINRRNRNMVSLVDVNRATNYTRFDYIDVLSLDFTPVAFEGGSVQLRNLYIPNNRIIENLRLVARGECFPEAGCFPVPGMTPADTLGLSWNPEYVLTNVPDARREFDQLQLSVLVARPTWGASGSLVFTNLQGDLDTVTGYDDPAGYGAGPYVRVNEGVNAFGRLPNFSRRELKISVFGNLWWRTQGGLFWTYATGDHFAPHFTITNQEVYHYRTYYNRQQLWTSLLQDLEGHRMFVGPRGTPQYESRGMLDLRLERALPIRNQGNWLMTVEVFNLVNMSTVTRVNTSANRGRNYYYFLGPSRDSVFRAVDENEYYKAVLERVPPRTLRIGTTVRF